MGLLSRLLGRDGPGLWRARSRWLHRLGYVDPPVAVQWISTSRCDLACSHCYSEAGRPSPDELSTDEACRLVVDELVRLECPTFVVAGGEALLRRDLPAIVAHAHARGVPWALHSHGGRVAALATVFERHPPVMAAISLDGPRALHDAFRGRAGSFDDAVRAIGALRASGCPEVVAGTTVTRDNADHLVDLLPAVLDSGAHSWGLHLVTPEGRAGRHPELRPTPDQLRRVAGLARRLRGAMRVELDNEWGSAGADDCFYRDDPFVCGAGRISCVVSATGEVMPCTTTDATESEGNVRDRPLSDIWATGFARFRSGVDPLRGDDRDCWLQTRHGGSCRAAAFPAPDANPLAISPVSRAIGGVR